MEKLEWNKDFETNIRIIDEQHQRIFALLNEIIDFCEQNLISTIETEEVIDELDNYMTLHMMLEEYYAKRYKFPGYNQLRTEHEIFKNLYKTFRYYFSRETRPKELSSGMIEHINIILAEWLKNHIFTIDKEFTVFMQDKNIEII